MIQRFGINAIIGCDEANKNGTESGTISEIVVPDQIAKLPGHEQDLS